jgi:predicted hydrocarbon binding protein
MNITGSFCKAFAIDGRCSNGDACRDVHYYEVGRYRGSPMKEDHSRMEERVEELMKMVKEAAGLEGESDEEDDDDVEIVCRCPT